MASKSELPFSSNTRETQEAFLDYLSLACSPDTCYPKAVDGWAEENPLWGHCAVVAEVVRRHLGGQIVSANLVTEDGGKYRHYWNKIEGEDQDLTISQFKSKIVKVSRVATKARVTDRETLGRVKLFEAKLLEILPHNQAS